MIEMWMDTKLQKYILLDDRIGRHLERRWPWLSTKSVLTQLHRGEILESLPESEQPRVPEKNALRVIDTGEHNIKLVCHTLDVAKVTDGEADLLAAVSSPRERFHIFRLERILLTLGNSWCVDKRVLVRLQFNDELVLITGIIRYKGPLSGIIGIMFGVELLCEEAEGLGTTDGIYENKRYFQCPPGFGVFVAVDKLRPQQNTPNGLEVGSMVELMDGESTKYGVISWIGELPDRPGETVAGLELEQEQPTCSDGTFGGRRYFACPPGRGLFVNLQHCRTDTRFQFENDEVTERRLRRFEQISYELETALATERQAHQETETRLHSSEQRSHELELSLARERQAREEAERRLQSSEQRSRASTPDWVLRRGEIILLPDRVIGSGAWGEVKEGKFRGSKVAVKKIHELILTDHNRRLFEREMNIASRCRHPCLLQFIGATNDDDQSPLFVTELLNTTLRNVLQERSLEPPEITIIALDVAKGLNYLHLSHPDPIIHRDISSTNVLLWKHNKRWRAKVSDYGTANFLQQSMTACPGAPVYSAPEAQTPRQSPKIDVYSFGVLLCEMNVNELPAVDCRNEHIAMVTNISFKNLIISCLQQNPEHRPTMAEIIETLENIPRAQEIRNQPLSSAGLLPEVSI